MTQITDIIIRFPLILLLILVSRNISAESPSQKHLREYLDKPEPSYKWEVVKEIQTDDSITTVVDMVSQTWLTEEEVASPEWRHWILVTKPKELHHPNTAILLISGGTNDGSVPDKIDRRVKGLMKMTGSIVAELQQVPNEPLKFTGNEKPLREDELIAYAGRQFLDTGDARWVARFPMVKSSTKALDTVQAFLKSEAGGNLQIDNFIVIGASKRGWTAWLVAAMDPRVKAVVPIVIDCLNVRQSMRHHFAAYGFWAPALKDYQNEGLLDLTATPEFESVVAFDDPYRFRDLINKPKYIVNATGDQYFLPDSSQFYFNELPGEKHLCYIANTDHSLDGSDAVTRIGTFCNSILFSTPRPKYTWNFDEDGSIIAKCKTRPQAVRLWQANNPRGRDFRLQTIGSAYSSTPIAESAQGLYVARQPKVGHGWTAYFVELEFKSPIGPPLKFTSGVRVTPDVLPFGMQLQNEDDSEVKSATAQAPPNAYLPGQSIPYYGTVDRWNRRFFEEHADDIYGRNAQRQFLHIQEGRLEEAIANCRQVLNDKPSDHESLFNITLAYCVQEDMAQAWQSCKAAIDAGLPLERFPCWTTRVAW